MQRKLGSSIITYPYLHLPLSQYKEFIDTQNQLNENSSTVFFLDMGMDSEYLKNLIDHIIGKGQPSIIGLRYRNWEETIPQHRVIASYIENERTAFFAAQIEREQKESHVSNLQSVAIGWGLDFVSLNQPRGHSDKQKLDLSKIRLFDPKTWIIDSIENTLGDSNRNLVREFDIPADNVYDIEYVTKVLGG